MWPLHIFISSPCYPGIVRTKVPINMKYHYLLVCILLGGCTISKTPKVADTDPAAGVVRLGYSILPGNRAEFDPFEALSVAVVQCQKWGYATAMAYGENRACTLFSGPQCLNYDVLLNYQCRNQTPAVYSVVTSH